MLGLSLPLATLALLEGVAFACGTVFGLGGPGGTPFVAALLAVAGFTPGRTAGTASVALFAVLLAGAAVYARSHDVRWRVALALVPTTLVGTQVGAAANARVSPHAFQLGFGVLVAAIGVAVLYRALRDVDALFAARPTDWRGLLAFAALGLLVGVVGGITGLGGPTIAVPALLLLDLPVLEAIGTAQVQGAFTTAATGSTYLAHGTVAVGAVAALVPALVVGLGVGWYLAHRVPERWVTLGIGVLLLALAPYFLL